MPDSSPPTGAVRRPLTPEQKPVTVLIADAHPIVRAGLRTLVTAQPDMSVVGEAGYCAEVLDLAGRMAPDVVVCETTLPGGDGLTARLQALGRRVLVLTVCAEPRTMREVLAAGACGYVLKRATADQVVQAVRVVAGGGTYLDPELAGCVVDGFRDEVGLSEREEQVIRLLARGYSNKEIAAQLRLSIKTVETYKARSMEKLKVHTRTGIVEYAVGRGWLAVADRPVVVWE